ncbi:MAG: hypothetical protein R2861_16265 [Desulfobacterales bacterium]
MRQTDFFAGAWRLIFLILAVIAGTAAPAVAADENTIKIRDVRFVGVRSISQKDLRLLIHPGRRAPVLEILGVPSGDAYRRSGKMIFCASGNITSPRDFMKQP